MLKYRFEIVFLILLVFHLIPVWIVSLLPFVDLPQHLSFATILKNYYNPALNYYQVYSLHLFPMHNTFHLFFTYLFSFLIPLEVANRIFMSLYIILLPLSLKHLIETLKGNRELSLLGFLFIYNFNLFWGFMGFAFALPLTIFLFSCQLRYLEKPQKSYLFLNSIILILTFLCHSLVYLFSLALYLIILFFKMKKGRFLNLVASLPSLLFFIPWQTSTLIEERGALFDIFIKYLSPKNLLSRLNEFFSKVVMNGDEITVFIIKVLTGFAVFFLVDYIRSNPSDFKERKKRGSKSLSDNNSIIFILLALLFYFFGPGEIREGFFLNERFAIFVLLGFAIFLGTYLKTLPKLARIILLVVLFLNSINIGTRFILYDKTAKDIKSLLSKLEASKKLVGLPYKRNPEPDYFGYPVFIHFPNYYQVWKNGYPSFSFAYIRFSPIRYREPPVLPQIDEWSPWLSIFDDDELWKLYDYFLIIGEPKPGHETYVEKWQLIARKGLFSLYQKRM